MKIKMKKRTRKIVTQGSRWSIFIMASFALGFSIADVAAKETMQLILANPELAQYTDLVNGGYLFFM